MLKLKYDGRLGTEGGGGGGVGWSFMDFLFKSRGFCLNAGDSREVKDENGNSSRDLLDMVQATFISYNWPKP